MEEMIRLETGDRLTVKNEWESLYITEGSCEVYVATSELGVYSQSFLIEVTAGQSIFPSFSADGLEFFVHSLTECVFEKRTLEEYELPMAKSALNHWFVTVGKNEWLDRIITSDEQTYSLWQNTFNNENINTAEELRAYAVRNSQILSRLIAINIARKERKKSEQSVLSQINKKRVQHQSVSNLFPDRELPSFPFATAIEENEVAAIVRLVANSLKLPDDNIKLPPHLAGKMDRQEILQRLVQRGNMMLRPVELKDKWYLSDSGTLIAYYGEQQQLVALLPNDEKSYRMVSAVDPNGKLVTAEIAAKLQDAEQCYAGFPSHKLTMFDLLRFMVRYTWKSDYITIILVSIVCGFLPIVSPIITETIFEDIIPIKDRQSMAAVAQVMLVSGFTVTAITMTRSIAVLRISTHVDMNADAALWGRLLRLPASFFRKYTTGEIINRMQGISAIKQFITGEMIGAVFNFIFSFWSLLLMIRYSAKLTVVAVFVWIVYSLIQAVIFRRELGFQRKLITAGNKAGGMIQQIFNGLPKIRIHGAEEQAFFLWSKVFGEQWKWNLKVAWQDNYTSIIGVVQPILLTMLIYYITVNYLTETDVNGQVIRSMAYPEFLAFQSAFSSFNATVTGIFPMLMSFFAVKPHLDNLRPIIETEPENADDKVDATSLTGELEVRHLSFSYSDDLPMVLDDISFKVRPHERVAIVGQSGCGKTTLLRLLLGMEKPNKGSISYDGQDLAELNLSSVRSQMGVVMQFGRLMTGDIFSNIVGVSKLTLDDAWEAAEMTGIANDIREMPMGMKTMISEGSNNISGGQRQRILLARAIVNRPAIIMLDEATCSLDNTTQAIVANSLQKLNSSQIIIAHRLSTVCNVDRILVLDGGKIAESGSYEELLAKGGIFSRMAKRQLL